MLAYSAVLVLAWASGASGVECWQGTIRSALSPLSKEELTDMVPGWEKNLRKVTCPDWAGCCFRNQRLSKPLVPLPITYGCFAGHCKEKEGEEKAQCSYAGHKDSIEKAYQVSRPRSILSCICTGNACNLNLGGYKVKRNWLRKKTFIGDEEKKEAKKGAAGLKTRIAVPLLFLFLHRLC